MQPAQPRKLGLFEPRDGAEHADLLGVLQLGLEADHVPQRAQLVVLAQLDHSIGPAAIGMFGGGPVRVVEAHGLHRPEPQCLHPALGHHLDRHAAVEIGGVCLPFLELGLLPGQQLLAEGQVLVLGHRAVDIVAPVTAHLERGFGALVPAAGHPGDVHVDGFAVDDRSDRIEEGQAVRPRRRADRMRQRLGRQRPGRDDGEAGRGQHVDPLTHHFQRWLRRQCRLDLGRKDIAVDRQGRSGRHPRLGRRRHDQRIELAHLVMQQANGVLLVIVRAERVGTDQFGQARGLVRRGHLAAAAHFRKAHLQPALGELPGGFAAGHAAADNVNVICHARAPNACKADNPAASLSQREGETKCRIVP